MVKWDIRDKWLHAETWSPLSDKVYNAEYKWLCQWWFYRGGERELIDEKTGLVNESLNVQACNFSPAISALHLLYPNGAGSKSAMTLLATLTQGEALFLLVNFASLQSSLVLVTKQICNDSCLICTNALSQLAFAYRKNEKRRRPLESTDDWTHTSNLHRKVLLHCRNDRRIPVSLDSCCHYGAWCRLFLLRRSTMCHWPVSLSMSQNNGSRRSSSSVYIHFLIFCLLHDKSKRHQSRRLISVSEIS